jgi:peptidoglycan/LPS O-acetylase OafA/YrhL
MHTTLTRTPDGRMPYFAVLDGARAYCILLVMFDHLKSNGHTIPWINGHLGVDLFFIISGFLITTLLRREQFLRGHIDFYSFYVRRFFRIVPVYVVVLAIYIVICQLPSQADKWFQLKAALPFFLTFLNEYAHEPNHGTVFMHTWSLGVEEKFYLLWPFLFFVLGKTVQLRRIIAFALILAICLAVLLHHGHLAQAYFGLLMGCVMGIVLSGPDAVRVFKRLARIPPSAALALFALGFLAFHLSKDLAPFFSTTAIIFQSSLIARPSWLSRLHAWPPLVWIGRRSYSMYLIHILCLNIITDHIHIDSGWRAALALTLAFALTALVADLLYRLIEQPCRNYGRRYLASRNEIPAAI